MDHSLFIHPTTGGHLGSFQVLATINRVAINTQVQVFVWTEVFNVFG